METVNMFEDENYVNTMYTCACCGKDSYEYETYKYTPKVIKAVESFLYYDSAEDVQRTTLYVCPHCGVAQLNILDI